MDPGGDRPAVALGCGWCVMNARDARGLAVLVAILGFGAVLGAVAVGLARWL